MKLLDPRKKVIVWISFSIFILFLYIYSKDKFFNDNIFENLVSLFVAIIICSFVGLIILFFINLFLSLISSKDISSDKDNVVILKKEKMTQAIDGEKSIIEVIAIAHERIGELKVFVQSWINQTESNWKLHVIHDGKNVEFSQVMDEFRLDYPSKISYECTESRFNDYGHSLREMGLDNASGDYVLITNADNYYVPKTLEFFNNVIGQTNTKKPDIIIFDMVHSHSKPGGRKLPSYSFFEVFYKRCDIDMGAAIVRRKLAQKVGFRDKSYTADAKYFENIAEYKVKIKEKLFVTKISRVLLIHN